MKTQKRKSGSPVSAALSGGLLLCALLMPLEARSAERTVAPGNGVLQLAIDSASAGDTLVLGTGMYTGSINIDRGVTLLGNGNSIVSGEGIAHVITVAAPDVLIKGLHIQGSGNSLKTEDSGVFVTEQGDRARIDSNRFENNLIGVNLKGPESAVVSSNVILGSRNHRVNERGNGVHLWNSPGSIVEDNDIRYGRDGIFVMTSSNNVFRGNRLRDLRFAVHYMYTNDSEVVDNVSINNHVGFALMSSNRLLARNNRSTGDQERGMFFNFTNNSDVSGNQVSGGPEKCVFIYNSSFNQFSDNVFQDCEIGIHFTGGSENNEVYSNAFLGNRTQVKYVGTRHIEWSRNGVGNYWSDNAAFDVNGDGIADQAYRPNDLVDQIVWRHPMARLLLNSPAVQALKWAQSEFPQIHPGGVTDSSPLLLPPKANIGPLGDSVDG